MQVKRFKKSFFFHQAFTLHFDTKGILFERRVNEPPIRMVDFYLLKFVPESSSMINAFIDFNVFESERTIKLKTPAKIVI